MVAVIFCRVPGVTALRARSIAVGPAFSDPASELYAASGVDLLTSGSSASTRFIALL